MSLCPDCLSLTSYLHTRSHGTSHTHKSVPAILRSSPLCALCNLLVSVPYKWQDNDEPAVSSLSLYNTEAQLRALEAWAEKAPERFPPVRVDALEDVCARTAEVVFEVVFGDERVGRIWLAVWKETPCADGPAQCGRHKPGFVSEHFFSDSPAENRWAQFCPCATSDVAYRPNGMFVDDESPETLGFLKSWLSVCENAPDHGPCQKAFSGELLDGFPNGETYAPLPHRILDIETDCVKLVETEEGACGAYIALSHCWGKPENHPPKTTKANFDEHLHGMPLSTLPETFRDAVKIARYLDVRYVWIDSLCIIQDDAADWDKEAAKMGAVYEYARLTIAAAGARDSTEGCFVTRRPNLQEIREQILSAFPPSDSEGEDNEGNTAQRSSPPAKPHISILSKGSNNQPITIHFGATPVGFYEPYYSPLGYRAWARQEWYLSRRMLFFTAGGLSWKCRTTQWNERERYYKMREGADGASDDNWAQLLERYSADELTFETDRLVALQGVATQMASRMDGEYHFGLWTHKPELLFWMMVEEPPRHDVKGPEAPSWSWASRIGRKFFWATMIQFALGHGQTVLLESEIDVDERGKLSMLAPIREMWTKTVGDEWVEKGYVPKACTMVPESGLILYAYQKTPILFLFESGDSFERAVGLAALDDQNAMDDGPVYCVFVLRTPRLLEIESEVKFDTEKSEGNAEGDQVPANGAEKPTIYEAMGDQIYWVLLVQEVEGKRNHFRRIGMGLINSSAPDMDVTCKSVHLV